MKPTLCTPAPPGLEPDFLRCSAVRAIVVRNGPESLIYAGGEAVVGAFVGYDSTVYYDYTEQVRNRVNDADNSASIPDVATPIMYVGATRPIKGFKLFTSGPPTRSARQFP